VSMDVYFREFEPYYTQKVSSPFGDSADTAGIRREAEDGEKLVNAGSIPLLIPSSIEQQPVYVRTRTQREVRYVYERRKK
jgi:hypothetical protein